MKPNGFSLIEAMLSLTVFLIITLSLLPVLVQTQHSERDLEVKRHALSRLHDHLLIAMADPNPSWPLTKTETIFDSLITVQIESENGLIKACASWQERHQDNQEICLYGAI
ncbi:type II secretion system protein [Thalassobacillus sp. CUG 92003]|uniref:type II secretion system protein n=1 Tax=Thalassobacillus sp. CUG 92003 TaxID=2736641 RepID=UPI0015E663ED|nr:type II secretion system protein [Thalassobacillus sp. CUG 92003]